VYRNYEIYEEDGELYVIAPLQPREVVVQAGEMKGTRLLGFSDRSLEEGTMCLYAPLKTPELVLDLAELAENEITPKTVVEWAEVYGLLGLPGEDIVGTSYVDYVSGILSGIPGDGRRDNVRHFAEAAGEVRACLRIYEAITADEDVDLDEMASLTNLLPPKVTVPFGPMERHAGGERSWLFRVIGSLVQTRLHEYCYPQFAVYTYGGVATGRFSLSWGFMCLIGAIWLHMAWLLEAEGERVKRCKLPGCLRVIHFEPGESAPDPGLKKNVRGTYKTRSDRVFCKDRGCKQKYHYRKTAGWRGYE
jgi:hypothetical protein